MEAVYKTWKEKQSVVAKMRKEKNRLTKARAMLRWRRSEKGSKKKGIERIKRT